MGARDTPSLTGNEAANSRTLPHPAEAEQSVLGGLLLDNAAISFIGELEAEHFYDERHRAIFAAIVADLSTSRPADVVTVHEALRERGRADDCGGLEYLNALAQSVPSAANIGRYAEIVREKSASRALISAADQALTVAQGPGDPADKLDRITSTFGLLARGTLRQMPQAIAEIAAERLQHYEALESGTVGSGWPTHIPALDRWLAGGLQPGWLYVLAARPSVGKSSLAQALGLNIARDGHPTLFLSMEMSSAQLADRALSNLGHVLLDRLKTGKLEQQEWARLSEAQDHLTRVPFTIDEQQALTLFKIRMKAKSIKGLQVLIVDYLQLCEGSRRREANRNAEVEEISRGMKALAKELGIAVILLSQLNREVEKRSGRRPILSDLRDSGAIEQDADVALLLWPVREVEDMRRIVGLHIAKNRDGEQHGVVGLDFDGPYQRWRESTADIRQQPQSRAGDDL